MQVSDVLVHNGGKPPLFESVCRCSKTEGVMECVCACVCFAQPNLLLGSCMLLTGGVIMLLRGTKRKCVWRGGHTTKYDI